MSTTVDAPGGPSTDDARAAALAGPAAFDAWVAAHAIPAVDGSTATFVYRGPADAVRVRHWIFGLPSSLPLERVDGTDVWLRQVELPAGSRVEYKLEVEAGGVSRLIRDPLNDRLARDPYGANSVCHGRGYESPAWVEHDPVARPGTYEDLDVASSAFGETRPVKVYVPSRLRPARPARVLIVHDGIDYLNFASLGTILDNLVERHEIPPILVACTQSPDRLREYAADPRHADFVVQDVLPALADRWSISEQPADRGVMGASFGGVAALSTAWRHPGVFGRLLLQSGSFAFTDIGDRPEHRGPVFDPVVRFMNAFRANPGRPSQRVFLSCGVYESLIYENRSLVPLLQDTGMDVRWVESRDGHNWENWRDRLREGLSWLFPGPLWFTYD